MNKPIDLGDTARTDAAESVNQERDAVGDQSHGDDVAPPNRDRTDPVPDGASSGG